MNFLNLQATMKRNYYFTILFQIFVEILSEDDLCKNAGNLISKVDIHNLNYNIFLCQPESCVNLNETGNNIGLHNKKSDKKSRTLVTEVRLVDQKSEFLDPAIFKIYPKLINLKIDSGSFKFINISSFQGANHLQFLLINGSALEILRNDTFRHLRSVVVLQIIFSNLKELEVGAFQGLCELINLYICYHKIEFLEPKIFDDLKQLEMLNLENGKLRVLRNIFTVPRKISYFNLNNNEIEIFEGMENLQAKFLLLQNNRLRKVFINSATHTALLNNNSIEKLECAESLNVVYFYATHNALSSFDCFCQMRNLETLDLSFNRFTKIPENLMAFFATLKFLQLDGNEIPELEELMTFNPKVNIFHGAESFLQEVVGKSDGD